MNPFEVLYDSFKPFLDGEKRPLNVLEVGNLWMYLAGVENTMRNEEIAYNTAQDKELKQKLKDARENVHQPIVQDIKKLFQNEGVPLPNSTPEKPVGEYKNIPEGVKLTDSEIANLVSFNLLLGLTYGMRGLSESVRADVGLLYAKIIARKMPFAITFKDLMVKRGWIQVPPDFKQ